MPARRPLSWPIWQTSFATLADAGQRWQSDGVEQDGGAAGLGEDALHAGTEVDALGGRVHAGPEDDEVHLLALGHFQDDAFRLGSDVHLGVGAHPMRLAEGP